jgi:DNA-directed RNA polymerase subunit RPC12/RpoP
MLCPVSMPQSGESAVINVNRLKGDDIMTSQHCPGFESNKTINEVKLKCPDCGKVIEVFSDEVQKQIKCPHCSTAIDTKTCVVD